MQRTAKRLVEESKVLSRELRISITKHSRLVSECKWLTERLSEARMESFQAQSTCSAQRKLRGL
jgi:hypothetical protein